MLCLVLVLKSTYENLQSFIKSFMSYQTYISNFTFPLHWSLKWTFTFEMSFILHEQIYIFKPPPHKCNLGGPISMPSNNIVWGEGRGPSGIRTQSLALHHCAGGLVTWVSGWCSLGGPICRWSCHHCWLPRGMCQEALDMERSHGEEGIEGECRKDKSHDLWYRPGPLAEFRRIPMRCLSYRSRQQQHLLQWLQTLGA